MFKSYKGPFTPLDFIMNTKEWVLIALRKIIRRGIQHLVILNLIGRNFEITTCALFINGRFVYEFLMKVKY